MPIVKVTFNSEELAELHQAKITGAIARAMRKAGSTALRDMRSEARKRIRQMKRLKMGPIGKALVMRRPRFSAKGIDGAEWAIDVRGTPVPLSTYPARQTRKGVSVEVNRGKRTLIKSAFMATMTRAGGLGGSAIGVHGGHRGVYRRLGRDRLPIKELLGSRPVDALLHKGEAEAVQARGARSFGDTFDRLLPLELEKGKGGSKGGEGG